MYFRKSSPHSQRSSSKTVKPSQRVMNNINTIDDLTDVVLVEILCRLPSSKFVVQCKCVSKRWCTLISDSYFVDRFTSLQIEYHAQTPITLINSRGEEFLDKMSKPLNLFLKKVKDFHGLDKQPVVVGAYNDLLLCCVGTYYQRLYYICNPYIQQWIALPAPPPCYKKIKTLPEGFMCDLPYYKYAKEDAKGHTVQLNPQYGCRVVRLISDHSKLSSNEFKVKIFSSETGEWRESVVSSPRDISLDYIDYNTCYVHASNRMLYWMGYHNFVLSFDPFLINNSVRTSSRDGDEDIIDQSYKCHLVDIKFNSDSLSVECLGVHGRCLKIYAYDEDTNTLLVLDLNGDEEFINGGFENFFLENSKRMEMEMINPEENPMESIILDPNNDEICYLTTTDGEPFMFNLGTKISSRMDDKITEDLCSYCFPYVLTCWPTPVPRLPQHI
ncbi:hypothetical protein D8674_018298 [Pyrus ussuriensis x Pyrus communis]|uniref:F-box domain-containing protein n=1 Tax=Pyrus ussuriensis x Pyrus communis TaxID=2448454 RepID=A0A5N5G4E7_9ROSA|nr:hypothetical protein D8674_018298 [Pyrus ussuriensis x Pyrus communis]